MRATCAAGSGSGGRVSVGGSVGHAQAAVPGGSPLHRRCRAGRWFRWRAYRQSMRVGEWHRERERERRFRHRAPPRARGAPA
eukprot:242424-Chlamydomonas_euryale.AAC.7